ncbi:MAG TPA: OmpA family protein [Thermoanaerobaculia bacterium]|nr:OmpA family protein [Thermoanaerobaculia bacterium]
MSRTLSACLLALAIAIPALAQGQPDIITQAQQVLTAAESAGAANLARSLDDDAQWRVKFAQANWNAAKSDLRDQARLRAEEALWAGRAALAKSQWLSANVAIRQLQADIATFGSKSDVTVQDEPSNIDYARGTTTRQHVDAAQAAIDQAKAAGGEQIAAADLKIAQENVNTARRITSANKESESADHLTYISEMMARRAYYLSRAAESNRYLPNLQLERTRLAQAASEQQTAAERAQREQAEKDRASLQQQLVAEQASRQAGQAEIDRLRQQLEESRRTAEQRSETDRQARLQAEQQLDALTQKYQAAIAGGNVADVEAMRRQVEDQQIALRAIQERERLNEQTMTTEIESLRNELQTAKQQGTESSQALAQKQADLERREQEMQALRKEREADLAHRAELEKQNQAVIADAQRRRQEAEAQAQQFKAQLEQAQQQAREQAQQTQAELDKTRQQVQQAQAELEKTRQELAQRDAEARRLRMQQELSRVATTKSSERGLIVTLSSGIMFDSGKSVLKPGAKKTLQRIADQLKSDSTAKIAVEGHTDSVGAETKNQELSEKRAQAVRDFLVNAGVSADHVTATGLGEKTPVATNKTAAGRQQNRRVELVITTG